MARRRRCAIAGLTATEVTGLKAFTAKSDELEAEGYRLDPKAFAQGGLQARVNIKEGDWSWQRLDKVAEIYRGPLHTRIYVQDAKHGWPYITASDVSRVDLPRDIRLSLARTPESYTLQITPDDIEIRASDFAHSPNWSQLFFAQRVRNFPEVNP